MQIKVPYKGLQFTLDEILSTQLFSIISAHNKNEINALVNSLVNLEKDYIILESTNTRKDKTQYPVELRLQLTSKQSRKGIIIIANDITLRKQAEKTLIDLNEILETRVKDRTYEVEKSLALIKATLQSTTDAILVLDNENKVIDYNIKYLQINSKDRTTPKIGLDMILPQLADSESFLLRLSALKLAPQLNSFDELIFTDGLIYEAYSQPQIVNKQITGRVWCFRDITNQKNMQRELIRRATHDTLTDIPNRLLLEDRLKQAISQANTTNTSLALLMIDIDRFKIINDTHGHQVGDLLLKEISIRIKNTIRATDTVARLGGDEFIVLLTLISEEQEISTLANNIKRVISDTYFIDDLRIIISSSIGISVYPKDTRDATHLIKNSDIAMYRSKEFRNNVFHFFAPEMHERALKRLEIESNLKIALEKNEFILNYQPFLNLHTGKIIGAEALIRWQHPKLGLVPPLDFIPIAEDSGTILPIGEWIFHEACRDVKSWHNKGYEHLGIAINISAQQFKQENFVEVLTNITQQLNLNPACIELELTESIMLYDINAAIKKMNILCESGFSIAIDDFGTGYSSLSYLKNLPIKKIKIDKSFVDSIGSDSRDTAIIIAIIAMAKSLSVTVIAEGVENLTQFEFLYTNGCDEIQGYLLSKPLNAESYKTFLHESPNNYCTTILSKKPTN